MAERGGPATQAGIHYQNSVAALYLGRLCDETPRQRHKRIERVQVEAPTSVDDMVVEYADGHREYIQVKLNLTRSHSAWDTLWRNFDAEFFNPGFQRNRDRLCLRIG